MLKKAVCIIFSCLLICCVWTIYSKPVFYECGKNYEIYSVQKSSGKIELSSDGYLTKYFYRYGEKTQVTKENALKKKISVESIIKDFGAQLKFTEKTDEGESFYAYSKTIKYIESVNGEKINLHIFIDKEGNISMGSPIIYGSF